MPNLSKAWGLLHNQHVLTTKTFTRPLVDKLLQDAATIQAAVLQHGKLDLLRGKVVALFFCEASTRTCSSFHTAALKMGADVLPVDV